MSKFIFGGCDFVLSRDLFVVYRLDKYYELKGIILKMPKQDQHYKVMTITTDDASRERMSILAVRMGTSLSGLVRQLVWQEFHKQQQKDELTV
jgi:hypothetical protein